MAIATAVVAQPSAALADTAPPAGTPATVSADALPTWQINGVVWAQVVVGDTVYATGQFTQARPPGSKIGGAGSITANNIFAYDITTGKPVTSFNHQLGAAGYAITASPDGSRVYVGGDFTTVDGNPRAHLAAFDTATNTLDTGFRPSLSAAVRAIVATNATVYAGGQFFSAGGVARSQLASFSAGSGALGSWKPKASGGKVQAMVMAPGGSRLIVGGSFTTLNGSSAYGMGAVDSTTGSTLAWAANTTIRDGGADGGIDSLSTDGTRIYGGGWSSKSDGIHDNLEGTFAADPSTGKIIWVNDCSGDTYGTVPIGQVLYTVSHAHDCSVIGAFPEVTPMVNHHALAYTTYPTGKNLKPNPTPKHGWSYQGQPDSTLLTWYPTLGIGSFTGQNQAAWSVAGNSSYVVLGGEFPTVNGTAQQGLVRFAVKSAAPNKLGPKPSSGLTPTASDADGSLRLSWRTTWDPDNAGLTYDLIRIGSGGSSTVVGSLVHSSSFWSLPTVSYTDKGVAPGTYQYQIKVRDPFGNYQYSAKSAPVKVTAAGPVLDPTYTAVRPCRIFDTRTGTGNCTGAGHVAKAPVGARRTLTVRVAGVAGVPSDATAVVLNLTAVGATRATYVSAWPAGRSRPGASNLNVNSADAVPNLAIVPVGSGGSISLYNNAGSVNLLADISGYFAPQDAATYAKAGPCRVFDTRTGTGNCSGAGHVAKAPVGARGTITVKVAGVAGVPSNATAVVVNLTAVDASRATYVTAWPAGQSRPGASNLNVNTSEAVPNLAIVPVGAGGSISLYNNAGSVNLLADISGYFAPQSGSSYSKAGPCRVFDTRSGTGNCTGAGPVARAKVEGGTTLTVKVTGVAGVPADATAVVLNLTAVDATMYTYVTAWPAGQSRPGASNLNVNSPAAVPNLAIVPIGAGGSISLYNHKGSVHLLADIFGYLAP